MRRPTNAPVVFCSEVDLWIGALLSVSVAVPLRLGLHELALGDRTAGLVVLAASALALLPLGLMLPIRYEIDGERLVARAGLLVFPVPLASIERVEPRSGVRFGLGLSVALSLDALDVHYRRGRRSQRIVISPHDRQAFLEALRTSEPALRDHEGGLVRDAQV